MTVPKNVRGGIAAALVAGLGLGAPLALSSPDTDSAKKGQAARLAAEDRRDGLPASELHAARGAARETARRRAAAVPLPAGGNFNGIRWELAEEGVPGGAIDSVLQYNAACQWLRALRDGREREVAEQILGNVPGWPLLRDGGSGSMIARAAQELRAGGGATATAILADCDATHEREIAYARKLGLPPSA